jgi:hypothetical protein
MKRENKLQHMTLEQRGEQRRKNTKPKKVHGKKRRYKTMEYLLGRFWVSESIT